MTEADTFRALSRPSFDEISKIYTLWNSETWHTSIVTELKAAEFLKQHGWTFEEFVIERASRRDY